ncbi:MAG: hypothetical protein O2971_19280 [Proteobacteria bacterium]|nr:hypothetical protein [Pseudomonadota bacterium]
MSNKDDLRSEYPSDLIKSGERGRYTQRFRDGTNVVLLDPDLHEKFPDSRSVNSALRDYLQKTGSAT